MYPYQNLSLEDMPGEVWKDIPGWEGYYQASTLGRVKSLSRPAKCQGGHMKMLRERVMSQKTPKTKERYITIPLSRDGTVTRMMVHLLVAKTFLNNPYNKPHVDHIDANRHNNIVTNLQWVTPKENSNNPISIRNMRHSSPRSNPIVCVYPNGDEVQFDSLHEAQRAGFNRRIIQLCLRGGNRKNKGCSFRYAD